MLFLEEIRNAESLELFVVCRLIPLDKRAGLRPTGVGEVLRRIAEKAAMIVLKKDVLQAAGLLQLYGGPNARNST